MNKFKCLGKTIFLPAIQAPSKASTQDPTAWECGVYETVRVVQSLSALRVHTNGKSYPGRPSSARAGAWILIGDVIQTSSELARTRSLPAANPESAVAFTHTSEAGVEPNTLLNIGLASAKFGGVGGEFQAEYVSGPKIKFTPIAGKGWHGTTAHA